MDCKLNLLRETSVIEAGNPMAWIRDEGPFDIIDDVHGCADELANLLKMLGYIERSEGLRHAEGRKPVFVGDLVDRGPNSPEVVKRVMRWNVGGDAHVVIGNHDDKLMRFMIGRDVVISPILQKTIEQFGQCSQSEIGEMRSWLRCLPFYLVLDRGNLIVSQAGLKEELHGRVDKQARSFALRGDVSDQFDENGFKIRLDWAGDYSGSPLIVHGHTAMPDERMLNKVVCVDTGCCFGGRLTALRYPEMEFVSVPAKEAYARSSIFH